MIITRSQSSFISQTWIDVGYICLKLTDTLTLVNCITYLSNVLQGFNSQKRKKKSDLTLLMKKLRKVSILAAILDFCHNPT